MRSWFAACLLASATWLAPQLTRADERTDARREFRAGMQAVAEGRYDEGIAHLESAYDTLPHPNVLYNIGLAHMYAGRLDAAKSYFERYKETAPPADAAQVDALIAELDAKSQPPATAGAGETKPSATAPTQTVDSVQAAASNIRRIAEETHNPALLRQAEELEATLEGLNRDKPAETPVAQPGKPARPTDVKQTFEQRPTARQTVYEEEVVSASRFAQSPLDAPNATAIITSQDIRITGLLNMTDLLRRVSGMEINSVVPTHAEVSIRGLNRRQSNKVLFLVDGRPQRLDFLGTSWFNHMPLPLEDVERIEIIKGPASALYGADAFSGIINVITRRPGQGKSYILGSYGNYGQARGAASFTGTFKKLSYRYSALFTQADNAVSPLGPKRIDVVSLTDTPRYARRGAALTAELHYDFTPDTQLTVGGSAQYYDNTVQGLSRLGQVTSDDAAQVNVYTTLNLPAGFKIAAWYDHLSAQPGPSYVTPGAIDVIGTGLYQDLADVDLSWAGSFKLLVPQTLTLGAGYRFKAIEWNWIDAPHQQHHFGAYLQDVLQLHKTLTLQLGARVDRHPLLRSLQFSPRGSLVWRFLEEQSLRVSIGRAFRGPSFLESYLQIANGAAQRGVAGLGLGNDHLDPEGIVSYELGYQNQASDYLSLEANVYFNTVKDAILFTDIRQFTLQEHAGGNNLAKFDPEVEAFPYSSIGFTNERVTYRQIGGELGARVYPVAGLDLYANYSIHDTSPFDKSKLDPVRAKEQQTSMHKVNAGLQYRAPFRVDFAVDMSWISRQVWVEQVSDPRRGVRFQDFDVKPLLWLNARVGYRLWNDRIDVGVVGTNLAFQHRRQHPFGQPLDTRVLGTMRLTF